MAEQFTPGPLMIKPEPDSPAPDYAIISGHYVIGEAYRVLDKETRAPAKANATLWAAAPDLYEACRMVLEHEDVMPLSVLNAAQRAINKAQGANA